MKILIAEDEAAAARQITQLIQAIQPDCTILAVLESVADTVTWLKNNPSPDLILMDIQLADGISFDIFRQTSVNAPVIFTTAYDEYALQAFKVNSIDYLLKPIDQTELRQAFEKFTRTTGAGSLQEKINRLLDNIPIAKAWKKRLVVKTHDGFESLHTEDITFFRAQDKQVFVQTIDGKEHLTDESLDELEKLLDPAHFFRLNRQYISSADSIEKIENHFNGKLKVQLRRCGDEDIYVSREKVPAFKLWLGA